MSSSCSRPPEPGRCAAGGSPRAAGAHRATETPHAEPLRPRTTHRPTLRWGDGARIRDPCRQRRHRQGGARGTSPLWTFICCSCFVGDV